MQTRTIEKHPHQKDVHLVWEIEIKDLGSRNPFLGYSLSGDYLLIGITSPDLQNKVDIQSLPKVIEAPIQVPIRIDALDFPQRGLLRFSGVEKMAHNWRMSLREVQSGIVQTLEKDELLSLTELRKTVRNLTPPELSKRPLKLELLILPK